MPADNSLEFSNLLRAWRNGDEGARDQLASKVYDELRRIARRYMKDERAQSTLQTTALVNEVYLRLVDTKKVDWQHRAQFFTVCAQMMRRILIDAARARRAEKRGGRLQRAECSESFDFDEIPDLNAQREAELLALHDALNALAQRDLRKAKIVELRFFGGLSVEETADVLNISSRTVMRDWKLAKAWLLRELGKRQLS